MKKRKTKTPKAKLQVKVLQLVFENIKLRKKIKELEELLDEEKEAGYWERTGDWRP